MSARQRPVSLSLASSRIVFTDSSRARSMKAHVLTMRHSASSGSVVRGKPASVSMPSISSESTWFLGQPRVVRWTLMSEAQYTLAHRRGPRRPPPSQTRLERASPAARRGVLRLALPRHPQDRLARAKPALERRLLQHAPGTGLRPDSRLDHVRAIGRVPIVHLDENRYQIVPDVRQPLVVTDEEPEGPARRRRLLDVERREGQPALVRPVGRPGARLGARRLAPDDPVIRPGARIRVVETEIVVGDSDRPVIGHVHHRHERLLIERIRAVRGRLVDPDRSRPGVAAIRGHHEADLVDTPEAEILPHGVEVPVGPVDRDVGDDTLRSDRSASVRIERALEELLRGADRLAVRPGSALVRRADERQTDVVLGAPVAVLERQELGKDVHQRPVREHRDLVTESLIVGPGVVNDPRRLPRVTAVGRAGEHSRPGEPAVPLVLPVPHEEPRHVPRRGVGSVPDRIHELGVGRVRGHRLLVVEEAWIGVTDQRDGLAPVVTAVGRLADQERRDEVLGEQVDGQANLVGVAVRRERDPRVGRAIVVAAVGGSAPRAAAEVRSPDPPGRAPILGEGRDQPVRPAVRPAVLLPHGDEVPRVGRVHVDPRLDLRVLIDGRARLGDSLAAGSEGASGRDHPERSDRAAPSRRDAERDENDSSENTHETLHRFSSFLTRERRREGCGVFVIRRGASWATALESDATVVRELDRDAEVALLQEPDHLLEVVAVLARDADLVLLDRGLHLELRVLDEADDLPRLLDRDPLLERDLLLERPAGGLLDLAIRERLERYAALVETRLEDVDDRLELHVVGAEHEDLVRLEPELVLRALEVVARLDLTPRLVEGIRDFLHVDFACYVERILGCHPGFPLLRGAFFPHRSGTVATPFGATNVKSRSGRLELIATFVKRIVTVFSN